MDPHDLIIDLDRDYAERIHRDDLLIPDEIVCGLRDLGCFGLFVPERFGGWKNIHKRFSRWAEKGVWENLFKALADDPDNEYAMIDATIVRAHQHSAGALKKGGKTTPSGARGAG